MKGKKNCAIQSGISAQNSNFEFENFVGKTKSQAYVRTYVRVKCKA